MTNTANIATLNLCLGLRNKREEAQKLIEDNDIKSCICQKLKYQIVFQ